jgi:putative spermidine/putrescine transport system substrate-binding protein
MNFRVFPLDFFFDEVLCISHRFYVNRPYGMVFTKNFTFAQLRERRKIVMAKKIFVMSVVISACLALLGAPSVFAEQALKVGTYGGYFKDSFDKHIYPDFTKETGIKIESIAAPTGEAWLVQLEQAARAGQAPADISMMSQTVMLRGQRTQLWTPYDLKKIPNHTYLLPQSINRYPDGRVSGIGAVGWYITLVSNTNVFKKAPTSWADMWKPDKKNSLGLLALASNSFLLEITAKTFFGGYDIPTGAAVR